MNFVVKSKSSGNEYAVQVYETEDGPVITCNCPAGENGQYCKHRFALVSGDEREVIEAEAPVSEIAKFVAGSRLEAAIDAMHKQEAVVKKVQADLRAIKKSVASAMPGRLYGELRDENESPKLRSNSAVVEIQDGPGRSSPLSRKRRFPGRDVPQRRWRTGGSDDMSKRQRFAISVAFRIV